MMLKNCIKKCLKSNVKNIKNIKKNNKYFSSKCEIKMYEYESASNPKINEIPIRVLKNDFNEKTDSTKILYFDLSKEINVDYKATSPNLLASFINLNKKSSLKIKDNSSSNMFYVVSGGGKIQNKNKSFDVSIGDIVTMPFCGDGIDLKSKSNLILYHVNDSPLMSYLGTIGIKEIVPPTIYKKENITAFMNNINSEKGAENRNRNGVLLGNSITEKLGTKTLTNVLWSLYNVIKPNSIQKPHKHNSVALDLCTYAVPNKVYTLIGKKVDENGKIINPTKVYWETGVAFTTPPGYWHSHVNESDEDASVLPVQDAGLYTYQRTLDIQFIND